MFNKDSLFFKILIALPLGIITGLIFYYYIQDSIFKNEFLLNGLFTLIGQIFICLMQMIVIPIIFCSIVCGSMSIGNSKTMGKIGLKVFLFYIFTTISTNFSSAVNYIRYTNLRYAYIISKFTLFFSNVFQSAFYKSVFFHILCSFLLSSLIFNFIIFRKKIKFRKMYKFLFTI